MENTVYYIVILALIYSTMAKECSEDANVDRAVRDWALLSDVQDLHSRFMISDPSDLWHKGIVPYVFDSTLPSSLRTSYRQEVFPVYEKGSCIRFVKWTDTTMADYGLNHNNYLIFEKTGTCDSFVGNVKKNGQRINCCGAYTCFHEIGHALGLHHEQNHPYRDEFVRINFANILTGKASAFQGRNPSYHDTFGYYDYDSSMHYSLTAWDKNEEPTITLLDPDMQYSSEYANQFSHFYLLNEINKQYGCTDGCVDDCKNGGYLGYIDDACRCKCPDGLKSTSKCAKLENTDPNVLGCGGITKLTDSASYVEIRSPTFPEVMEKRVTCTWVIQSPANTQMVLSFPTFSVRRKAGVCLDEVSVRHYMAGIRGVPFCGDTFGRSMRTTTNILIIRMTQKPTSVKSRFVADVHIVHETDMCYKKGGHNFVGHATQTEDSTPCLYWDEVTNCPHNLFNALDEGTQLVENYCRRPDSSPRPWCYTGRETCARAYCDACQLGVCEDTFSDCEAEMADNSNFCTSDPEASHGCRRSCGFCADFAPLPSISEMVCGPPYIPTDAVFDGTPDTSYSVGDTVTLACATSDDRHTITCLSDGTWTPVSFVCGTCKSGWVHFNKHCYKLMDTKAGKAGAERRCGEEHPLGQLTTDLTVKEHDILTKLLVDTRGQCHDAWIALSDVNTPGQWYWEDGSNLKWTHWNPDVVSNPNHHCAQLTYSCEWKSRACSGLLKVVCKYPQAERVVCADQRPDCQSILSRNPDFCREYKTGFAWNSCPETCGRCTDPTQASVQCTDENAAQFASVSTQSVTRGKVILYTCDSGFGLRSGALQRACLLSGKLTGKPPVCTDEWKLQVPVNTLEMRDRMEVGEAGYVYTATNPLMTIPRDGKITHWEFYSSIGADLALQVWRRINESMKFKLIGQTFMKGATYGRQYKVKLVSSERIAVKQGDIIGAYYPGTPFGIPFDHCHLDYVNAGSQFMTEVKHTGLKYYTTGTNYEFKDSSATCLVFSLNARVLPVSEEYVQ